MAEQHPTTFAAADRSNGQDQGVPSTAGSPRAGMTRRTAMTAMTALAAAPAAATIPVRGHARENFDRRAWDEALARYREADLALDRLIGEHSAAEERWDEACPREDRFFDEYGLRIGMKRDQAEMAAMIAVAVREGGKGADALIRAEGEQTADEFMAFQKRNSEAKRACRVDELRQRVDAYFERHCRPAREALMRIPAPDQAALLVKMEICAVSLNEEHAELALADAKRLLSIN